MNPGTSNIGNCLGDCHPTTGWPTHEGQRRSLAHRHCLPSVAIKTRSRNPGISDWDLPGTDHLITDHLAADTAVANRDQKSLIGHRRQA